MFFFFSIISDGAFANVRREKRKIQGENTCFFNQVFSLDAIKINYKALNTR